MYITLTPEELTTAKEYALRRNTISRQNNLQEKDFDKTKTSLEIDIIGAIAEAAAAKFFKQDLPLINSFKNADMWDDIEIRGVTRYKGGWRNLIVRDGDKEKFIVGICVANMHDTGPYLVAGWYKLSWVKPEWLKCVNSTRPFYGVPLAHLKPIQELLLLKDEF